MRFVISPLLLSIGVLSLNTVLPASADPHYRYEKLDPAPEYRLVGICPQKADDPYFVKLSKHGDGRVRFDYCRKDSIGDCKPIGEHYSYPWRSIVHLQETYGATRDFSGVHLLAAGIVGTVGTTFLGAKQAGFAGAVFGTAAGLGTAVIPAIVRIFEENSYEAKHKASRAIAAAVNQPGECLAVPWSSAKVKRYVKKLLAELDVRLDEIDDSSRKPPNETPELERDGVKTTKKISYESAR